MNGSIHIRPFKEIQFTGGRFDDTEGFLDFEVLRELETYQKILIETAKDLWRQSNHGRRSPPEGFKERFRLGIGGVLPGSCKVAIDRRIVARNLDWVGDGRDELDTAAASVDAALLAAQYDDPFPTHMAPLVQRLFKSWGKSLRSEERIVLGENLDSPPVLNDVVRTRLIGRLPTREPESKATGLSDLYGIWKGLEITEEEIAESKLKLRDIQY